jgi:carboxymethylenebutenolidase
MKPIIPFSMLLTVSIVCTNAVAQTRPRSTGTAEKRQRTGSPPLLLKTPGPMERLQTSPRHHEWEEIDSADGRKVRTWVVYPEVDHAATVVILIHENRGLTDWVRATADEVAEAGYIAVAPDLLSGTAPGDGGTEAYASEQKAIEAISGLRSKQKQVAGDLDAVFEYASRLKAGNKKVAVAGFCWGGGQTFRYATHNPKIAAAFVFYGPEPDDEDAYKQIEAPVYGFYGGDDYRISGAVPDVEKRMKAAGKKYEPVIYKGAKHAFMRQGEMTDDANDPNRKARDEAWKRWTKLLGELK